MPLIHILLVHFDTQYGRAFSKIFYTLQELNKMSIFFYILYYV